MLAASKDDIVNIIRNTARFGEAYALRKYDAIIAAAQDTAVFGRALPSNAVRIRLYIDTYQESGRLIKGKTLEGINYCVNQEDALKVCKCQALFYFVR